MNSKFTIQFLNFSVDKILIKKISVGNEDGKNGKSVESFELLRKQVECLQAIVSQLDSKSQSNHRICVGSVQCVYTLRAMIVFYR